jgi:hypothetical protein
MDAPFLRVLASGVNVEQERMLTPGAKMSRHVPKLEKDARASFVPVAPTVMALAAEAGDLPQASSFPFPAETATMTPAATALFTASLTGV